MSNSRESTSLPALVILLLLAVGILFVVSYKDFPLISSESFHAAFQITASLISSICALIFLIRFFIFRQRLYLFLGLSFLIFFSLELTTALVFFRKLSLPSLEREKFLSVLFLASNWIFLVFFLVGATFKKFFLSYIISKRKMIFEAGITALISIGVGFLLVYIVFLLSQFYLKMTKIWNYWSLQHMFTSFFFIFVISLYYRIYYKEKTPFWWAMLIFISLNFLSNFSLGFSASFLDAPFVVAQTFKVISYCALILGVSFESIILFEKERKLKESLELANSQLKKLDKFKSKFLSSVSHELRAPLGVISESISQLLEGMGGQVNSFQRKTLEIAKRNTHHLTELINDILDIQRIEAGKMELKKEVFDLRDILKEVYEVYRPKAQIKGIELILDIPYPLFLYADPRRIRQILDNFLSNSLKFTDKGFIKIFADKKADKVYFSVRDTGCGIRKEDLAYIFDKFRQFGKSTEGTGLGLAIVKELVSLHDGEIFVKSEEGLGTEFKVVLPGLADKRVFEEFLKELKEQSKLQNSNLFVLKLYQTTEARFFKDFIKNSLKDNLKKIVIFDETPLSVLLETKDVDKEEIKKLLTKAFFSKRYFLDDISKFKKEG